MVAPLGILASTGGLCRASCHATFVSSFNGGVGRMDLAYSHTQSQRVLKQRNMLLVTSLALAGLSGILGLAAASRDREVVLQPVLRTPVTISSAGVTVATPPKVPISATRTHLAQLQSRIRAPTRRACSSSMAMRSDPKFPRSRLMKRSRVAIPSISRLT